MSIPKLILLLTSMFLDIVLGREKRRVSPTDWIPIAPFDKMAKKTIPLISTTFKTSLVFVA